MTNTDFLGPWIHRFLMEHLVGERNLSRNTQLSYRDTLLLLICFVTQEYKIAPDKLMVGDLTANVIRSFLKYLEENRNCSVATRNQRLAAIHALARFIAQLCPEHIAWASEIRSIPFKKTSTKPVGYLEKSEMNALLDAPDQNTFLGRRDYTLLLFLYNSGARADEVAHLNIGDLNLGNSPSVTINGKGNKTRLCPLWSLTTSKLLALVDGKSNNLPVFLNHRQQRMTRHGVYSVVKRYHAVAAKKLPSLATKDVSPHTIRHTTAVHLLRAGVDINTIRVWLAHVSLDTTNIYAEVDLEMKTKALNHCELLIPIQKKNKGHDREKLLTFLKSL